VALPVIWLVWQAISARHSVKPSLSGPTVMHFAACVVCFYLGAFSLGPSRRAALFWGPIAGAMGVLMFVALQQHFGGLEATRKYYYAYILPTLHDPPPAEYLKKLDSTRVFGTLFYPNSLAGALLLFAPPLTAWIWRSSEGRFTPSARAALIVLVAIPAAACLFWSGSKGGWLLALLLGFLAALRLPLSRTLRIGLISVVLVAGITGFLVRYSAFFKKGATSVSARFDYWQAATRIALEHPVTGTGPGTFAVPYQTIKRQEAEMSRLVHNDYLQQASDSGFPGFLAYLTFVGGTIVVTARRCFRAEDFPIWLGILGWALQGFIEFSLYIPALSWAAFCFLGASLSRNPVEVSPGNLGLAKAELAAKTTPPRGEKT
jgi:O-antigen ligase